MAKQLTSRTRRASAGVPKTQPSPAGRHLRAAVNTVLAELAGDAPVDHPRLEQLLRAGLAWTAAMGDTCLVAYAVVAVRQALGALAAGDRDQAVAALLAALDGLPDQALVD
jgi:hypothetical protein